VVPQDKRVEGSHVIQANALVGYALTEYSDGLEGEPAHLPWVDNYIAYFKIVVAPSCELASLPACQQQLLVPAILTRLEFCFIITHFHTPIFI
jgi:hypothetical protein